VSAPADQRLCWIRGAVLPLVEAAVPVADRGFLFGEGLFETVRVARGRALRLEAHLARLARSAADLGLAPPRGVREAARALLERWGARDGVLKIVATAGPEPAPGEPDAPGLVLLALPPRPLPARAREDGVVAAIAAAPHPGARSPLAGAKTLAYFERALARRRAAAEGAWEAIFLGAAGEVAEGAASNVFWARGGRLCTPALEIGIVPGIARAAVLALAAAEEGRFPLEDLLGAEEAFLTNALVGVLPLCAIAGRAIGAGAPGPTTRALAARLEAEADVP
jgi:branched-subunit amino acid aminotransferase/4-amino-4-deoxychorismate lyase